MLHVSLEFVNYFFLHIKFLATFLGILDSILNFDYYDLMGLVDLTTSPQLSKRVFHAYSRLG